MINLLREQEILDTYKKEGICCISGILLIFIWVSVLISRFVFLSEFVSNTDKLIGIGFVLFFLFMCISMIILFPWFRKNRFYLSKDFIKISIPQSGVFQPFWKKPINFTIKWSEFQILRIHYSMAYVPESIPNIKTYTLLFYNGKESRQIILNRTFKFHTKKLDKIIRLLMQVAKDLDKKVIESNAQGIINRPDIKNISFDD